MTKTLYIIRGVPGSGKSTYVKNHLFDIHSVIHSTDDVVEKVFAPKFIGKGGIEGYKAFFKYITETDNYGLFGAAHKQNQENARRSMYKGIHKIIIDNTNLTPKECHPYVKDALDNGYEVMIITIPLKNTAEELDKRNIHGVPLEVIKKMIEKFKLYPMLTVDDVLRDEDC